MRVLVLGGDGIGPEVTLAAQRVLETISHRHAFEMSFAHDLVGGACYDQTGLFSTDEMMARAYHSDAILFGSEGGPKWDVLEIDCTPEERSGLTRLRRELSLFANIRPIQPLASLLHRSSVRPEILQGVDFHIVRELCGGIYYGTPRGITRQDDGTFIAVDTLVYHESEIARVARVAFLLARARKKKVTSVDKANVLESSVLWRRMVTGMGRAEYQDVKLEHMYVDNAAMQLIRDPRQFDVWTTENLFGDILSDGAAMLTGSIGMLPSASLAVSGANGHCFGLYEPVHGSANEIAGQGIANPIGAILSAALLMNYSAGRTDLADVISASVSKTVEAGIVTADLGGSYTTEEVTESILSHL